MIDDLKEGLYVGMLGALSSLELRKE